MEKTFILSLLIILLSSCNTYKSFACSKHNENIQLIITVDGHYDVIENIMLDEKIRIDDENLLNEDQFNAFLSSLDDSYSYLDGYLYRHQSIIPDKDYSLMATIEQLKKERYYCD